MQNLFRFISHKRCVAEPCYFDLFCCSVRYEFHIKLIHQTTCEITCVLCEVLMVPSAILSHFLFPLSFIRDIPGMLVLVTGVFALCTNIISAVVFIEQTFNFFYTYFIVRYAEETKQNIRLFCIN